MASRIYELRTTIEGQILAYFILEFTLGPSTPCDLLDRWVLNMDGALNIKGFGIGIILKTPEGSLIEHSFTLGFPATNNEVEYKVVIASLKMATTLRVNRLKVRCDSLLVMSQTKVENTAKDERMAAYMQFVLSLKFKFLCGNFKQISRPENNHTDSLANIGSVIEHQFSEGDALGTHCGAQYSAIWRRGVSLRPPEYYHL